MIRRRKKDVALQLPGRMDKVLFVPMTEQQRSIHEEFQSCVAQLVYKWTKMRFLSEKDRKRSFVDALPNANGLRQYLYFGQENSP